MTGDDFGRVKLYWFPLPTSNGNKSKDYGGHSSHVPNVGFTSNNEYVISVGGNDKAVLQFTFKMSSDETGND